MGINGDGYPYHDAQAIRGEYGDAAAVDARDGVGGLDGDAHPAGRRRRPWRTGIVTVNAGGEADPSPDCEFATPSAAAVPPSVRQCWIARGGIGCKSGSSVSQSQAGIAFHCGLGRTHSRRAGGWGKQAGPGRVPLEAELRHFLPPKVLYGLSLACGEDILELIDPGHQVIRLSLELRPELLRGI